MTLTPLTVATVSVCLSVLALLIGFKNYRRKAGIHVRGVFSTASGTSCDDIYVTEVVLENLKDRAVTIFCIYLKIGHNYYLELENLEEKPLVLRAFETHRKEFGPIEFYGISSDKIMLKGLLRDRRVKKRLVLSTSDGQYRVPSSIRRWSPVGDFFKNHLTGVIRPVYSIHKDKYVGGNIAFVIEIVALGGDEEIVLIHPRDYELRRFRNFQLTRDSLSSKKALEELLQKQMDEGNLPCKSYVVYDLQAWREKAHEFYSGARTIQAQYYGAFQYYVLGRLRSRYDDWKLNRENVIKKRTQETGESE
jgi:hypothetical protein